jgi:hypothetical protein
MKIKHIIYSAGAKEDDTVLSDIMRKLLLRGGVARHSTDPPMEKGRMNHKEEQTADIIDNEALLKLPRNSLLLEALGEPVKLPKEVANRLPLRPDHEEEARRECVYQFLERVLLPRMRQKKNLTVLELVLLAGRFKDTFRNEHPRDFVGEFELLPQVELLLMQLLVRCKVRKDTSKEWAELSVLVRRAAEQLENLLDGESIEELAAH